MDTHPCMICERPGHHPNHCPALVAPLKEGFYTGGGGGGGHSHDDDEEHEHIRTENNPLQ